MKSDDFTIFKHDKLDGILANCCRLVMLGQQKDPRAFGRVAACVIDHADNRVYGINYVNEEGKHVHAERAALENYSEKYGQVPNGCIMATTLSPCCYPMSDREGESCTDLINATGIRKVYCGYEDPTGVDSESHRHKKFHTQETKNKKLVSLCKRIADTFL